MKRQKIRAAILYIFSFFIPAVVILAALAGLKVTPFGDNSLVISDGNALYINYMGYIDQVVKGQAGVLYSFVKGLGGNMMGSWGWFLLNPFFVLFALIDITHYMQMYTFVSMLNFCVCGLTMYILLKDIYGHKGGNLLFSTAYALNGFLVANVFQLNFFSVIPVLPIMAMGLKRILRDKNPAIYIFSIAYSLLTNFYFGFMLCVASFLIFIVFFIAHRKQIANKKSVTVKYIISSFIGGCLSSIVWLPALLSLRGGRLDQSILDAITFRENMPFLDMFSKFFTGASSTAELQNGLPNIFVGILPVYLVILFFINKRVTKQWKLTATVFLLFYLISFYIPVFNIAMHGGTVTNWFNYRDSFVFCFFMLMIAAEEWQHITDESGQSLKCAATILIVASLIVFNKRFEYVSGGMVLLDFIILALMILAYWMHKKDPLKNPKHTLTTVVLMLMCVNLYANYFFSTKNIMEWGKTESEYQAVTLPVGALVDGVKKSDNGFYRMEIGEQRTGNSGNDPMLYGYFGVGHSGSDERDFVRLALSELGIHRCNMRNSYGQGISAATDTLLGMKYIISKENLVEEKGYERLIGIGEWSLFRNPYALPIGMVTDAAVEYVENDIENVFDNLNRTWSAMTGNTARVFVEEEDILFSSHNITDPLTLTSKKAANIVSTRDLKTESELENSIEAPANGLSESYSESIAKANDYAIRGTFQEKPENVHYIMYTFTARRDGAVYSYNRSGMSEDNGSAPPALNYDGYYHKGDTVTGYIPVFGTLITENLLEEVAGRFRLAYADTDVLTEMSQTILNRPSKIEKITDSHLCGEFTAEAGQKLMFTIPYDEGWTCYVDGEEVPINMVLGVFMSVDVPEGTHSYEMKFFPTGLKTGIGLSAAALLTTIVYIPVDIKRRKRQMSIQAEVQVDEAISAV